MSNYEKLLSLAKVNDEAERYDESLKYIDEIANSKKEELTIEERTLLNSAYKNLINARRDALHNLNEYEIDNKKFLYLLNDIKLNIEKELNEYCNRMLNLIDNVLLKNVTSDESKVFYIKMKADYYRYIAETLSGDKKNEIINKSINLYKEAEELAKKLDDWNPVRLGLALNFSMFYYEVMNDAKKAIEVANAIFEVAINELDKVDDDLYKDTTTILQLLKENIDNWTKEMNEEKKEKEK